MLHRRRLGQRLWSARLDQTPTTDSGLIHTPRRAPAGGGRALDGLTMRQRIDLIERAALDNPEFQIVPPEPDHFFAPGVYVRRLVMPKGFCCVSKVHKTRHIFLMSYGDFSVISHNGQAVRLKGQNTLITEPGTKRLVYAHEETCVHTIHVTDETDLEKIEAFVIASPEEAAALADDSGGLSGLDLDRLAQRLLNNTDEGEA